MLDKTYWIRLWLADIERRCSEHTLKRYRIVAWQLSLFLPDNLSVLQLEHLESFLATKKIKKSSLNTIIIAIKSFGHFLTDHDIPNPAAKLHKLPVTFSKRMLTDEEYSRVLKATSDKHRAIIKWLANTGLRSGEIISMKPENVKGKFLHIIGKGNRPRIVPLNNVCLKILNRYPTMSFSKNLNRTQLWRICRKASYLADIEPFSPHDLRHFFATRCMREGISIFRISKTLGHASVLTTERIYIDFLATIDLAGITDCLDK